MPRHVRSTRTYSRRRLSSQSQPPGSIAASLDLGIPGERAAHDLLLRFSSGRHPIWRLLAMRRIDRVLCVAVEWLRSRAPRRFSVVDVFLDEPTLRWNELESEQAALAALSRSSTSQQSAERDKAA